MVRTRRGAPRMNRDLAHDPQMLLSYMQQETPSQQRISQQTPPQQRISQQTPPQQRISKETPPQQKISQETPSQQKISQQTPPPQRISKETPPQQKISQQTPPPQRISKETPPQQKISQQTPPQQKISQQTPPQQKISQQTPPQQRISQQTPPQQKISQQTPPQQKISHQTPPQQKIPQEISPSQKISQQTPPQQKISQEISPPQKISQQTPPQQKISQKTPPQQKISHQTPPQQRISQQTPPQQRISQQGITQEAPDSVAIFSAGPVDACLAVQDLLRMPVASLQGFEFMDTAKEHTDRAATPSESLCAYHAEGQNEDPDESPTNQGHIDEDLRAPNPMHFDAHMPTHGIANGAVDIRAKGAYPDRTGLCPLSLEGDYSNERMGAWRRDELWMTHEPPVGAIKSQPCTISSTASKYQLPQTLSLLQRRAARGNQDLFSYKVDEVETIASSLRNPPRRILYCDAVSTDPPCFSPDYSMQALQPFPESHENIGKQSFHQSLSDSQSPSFIAYTSSPPEQRHPLHHISLLGPLGALHHSSSQLHPGFHPADTLVDSVATHLHPVLIPERDPTGTHLPVSISNFPPPLPSLDLCQSPPLPSADCKSTHSLSPNYEQFHNPTPATLSQTLSLRSFSNSSNSSYQPSQHMNQNLQLGSVHQPESTSSQSTLEMTVAECVESESPQVGVIPKPYQLDGLEFEEENSTMAMTHVQFAKSMPWRSKPGMIAYEPKPVSTECFQQGQASLVESGSCNSQQICETTAISHEQDFIHAEDVRISASVPIHDPVNVYPADQVSLESLESSPSVSELIQSLISKSKGSCVHHKYQSNTQPSVQEPGNQDIATMEIKKHTISMANSSHRDNIPHIISPLSLRHSATNGRVLDFDNALNPQSHDSTGGRQQLLFHEDEPKGIPSDSIVEESSAKDCLVRLQVPSQSLSTHGVNVFSVPHSGLLTPPPMRYFPASLSNNSSQTNTPTKTRSSVFDCITPRRVLDLPIELAQILDQGTIKLLSSPCEQQDPASPILYSSSDQLPPTILPDQSINLNKSCNAQVISQPTAETSGVIMSMTGALPVTESQVCVPGVHEKIQIEFEKIEPYSSDCDNRSLHSESMSQTELYKEFVVTFQNLDVPPTPNLHGLAHSGFPFPLLSNSSHMSSFRPGLLNGTQAQDKFLIKQRFVFESLYPKSPYDPISFQTAEWAHFDLKDSSSRTCSSRS